MDPSNQFLMTFMKANYKTHLNLGSSLQNVAFKPDLCHSFDNGGVSFHIKRNLHSSK